MIKMNEILAQKAAINADMHVLDAGCGIGGSSIWLSKNLGCKVTGITISPDQVEKAKKLAVENGVSEKVTFEMQDYCSTHFPDASFEIVWALESVCYAEDKALFVKEAYRLLKPAGKLVLADGMVNKVEDNSLPIIRKWLDGWVVNYLESPTNWEKYTKEANFSSFQFDNITPYTKHSSKRLFFFSLLAYIWAIWKKYIMRKPWGELQIQNIKGAFYQYLGMRKGLWKYGLFVATK